MVVVPVGQPPRPVSQPPAPPDLPTGGHRGNSAKPRVMFTGLLDKSGEETVRELGGELVDSVYQCTHLVTDKVGNAQPVSHWTMCPMFVC